MYEIRRVVSTDRFYRRAVVRMFENYGWARGYPVTITEKRRLWGCTVMALIEVPDESALDALEDINKFLDELERL